MFLWMVLAALPWHAFASTVSAVAASAIPTPLSGAAPNERTALALERQHYHDAVRALDARRWDDFSALRQQLDAYPLAIYLDYYRLTRNLHALSVQEAQTFLARSADSPLHNRFLAAYLDYNGKRQRWTDFLQVKSTEPATTVLQCYFYRAHLATGERERALHGAERLWVHGTSQPDECDPLFSAWEKSGGLTDTQVWARMLAAFESRQPSLMRYVAGKGSASLRPWTDKLRAVYARPQSVASLALAKDEQRSADIAALGISYLARYNTEQALSAWQGMRDALPFSKPQADKVESAIAQRMLFAEDDKHAQWLHGALSRVRDDKLTGIRLRWALAEADWATLERTLPLLSNAAQEQPVWRYWQAIALAERGEGEASTALLQGVAAERDYYGFLAADRLNASYQFNERPVPPLEDQATVQLPAIQRVEELTYHDEHRLAHSEWYQVLRASPDAQRTEQLAGLAADRGWYRMAIDAASRAKAWDVLQVRFPLAYQSVFDHYAERQQVTSTELMAISRRESAFFPYARSPVGARGLMQIMPATGRQVAASLNSPHRTSQLYEIEHNVLLGSTYYRQLLERYDGNRIFALAAYNAGPHRVDRWRKGSAAQLSAERWVETIPFRETRNYVQAVLAYNMVFQHLMGEDSLSMMTEGERQLRY